MQNPPLLDLTSARAFQRLTKEQKRAFIQGLTEHESIVLKHMWEAWARDVQLPPRGSWSIWLNMGGRGSGKTRAGAEWIRKKKDTTPFLHLIGRTAADVRDVMVEGESGLLAVSPPWDKPIYQPSKRRIVWNNGAQATTFSADEPESLRGPQCGGMWCLAGETPVLLANGSQRPISDIRVGEYVMTRNGPRRVIGHSLTKQNSEVYLLRSVDGRSIIGTAEHPVWVEGRGFTQMFLLSKGMSLCVTPVLNGTGTSGTCVQERIITSDGSCFIEPSGNKPTERYQRGITSITRMVIKRIIGWKTWNCSRKGNTAHCTIQKIWLRLQQRQALEVERLFRKICRFACRERSYALPVVESIIALLLTQHVFVHKSVSMLAVQGHLREKFGGVNSAPTSTMRPNVLNDIAHKNAMRGQHKRGFPPLRSKLWSALIAMLYSSLSGQMPVSVRVNAPLLSTGTIATVEKLARRYDVYDIAIEDAHEFFANGILVHNCDEIGAWQYEDSWDQAMFGLRLGTNPQACATTTPRVTKLVKKLIGSKQVTVTRSTTHDNKENLAPSFFTEIIARYANTRLGRQEIEGLLLEDFEGALWTRDLLEKTRVIKAPELLRIVVGVDPSVTNTEDSDETGIIVAGEGIDHHAYVLADYTLKGTPLEWASAIVSAYYLFSADRIIGEVNNGGDLIEQNIRVVDPSVSYKSVHATRGKILRAEPIVALYEQERAHHVGNLPFLEDEQCTWELGQKSPNRIDAVVWALTELGLNGGEIPIASSGSREEHLPLIAEIEDLELMQRQHQLRRVLQDLTSFG